ncbi:MAG: methyltransferase domain-containing protein [Lachnospiraceae bacterium]|nr:methyltransferase domain-containing protein [Lachnospiraceae bacterium]
MKNYEGFALVYDIFMKDINYNLWTDYIKDIWDKNHLEPKLVAELGCGTGNITRLLSEMGYDMIGIDISEEMLSIAKRKEGSGKILYLLQDMREFELYGTVDSIISPMDSINYITDSDELVSVFKLVNNYLEPGGIFIFDLNTEYKFKDILADNSFSEINDSSAYIWENFYDESLKINEYSLNFFIEMNDGKYRRFEETHYEKAYSIEEIKKAIEKSGMRFLNVYDAFTFNPPSEESERVFFIAKEVTK